MAAEEKLVIEFVGNHHGKTDFFVQAILKKPGNDLVVMNSSHVQRGGQFLPPPQNHSH